MQISKKKILLSAYACSPIRGSEPGNGWNWSVGLARLGYQVWCFTNVEDKEEIETAAAKLQLPDLHFVFVPLSFNLDKKLLDTSSKKIYFHYNLWHQKAGKIASRLHRQVKFDIAHHVTFGSLQQGGFIWKLDGAKKIFGPVGGGQHAPALFEKYFGKSWNTEKIRTLISNVGVKFSSNFRNTMLKSDYVLVTNEDTLELALTAKNINPDKVLFVPDTAVPQVMEQTSWIPKPAGGKLKLLWVGRLLPRKGLNLVLNALKSVPAHVDYSLTIVGGGECFPLLDGWIKEYGIDKNKLNILGQIPFAQVIEEYKKADVFIFCSMRDSFGAQLTEAMAFGLPVITLNIHGVVKGVPDNCGVKVPVMTIEQTLQGISDGIVKMHDDVDFRIQCSKNAFEFSKQNTWPQRIKHVTEEFYESK